MFLQVVCLFSAGYGYITPQTPAGQILCIFVSLLGIPITLLAFKSVGELIAKGANTAVTKFEKKILKRSEPKLIETKSAVILFSIMVLLIVVNSLLMRFPQWSFVEGVYFWFISLTTIGFGDYLLRSSQRITKLYLNSSASQQNEHMSLDAGQATSALIFLGLFFTFYYIFGLCIVSSVLNSIMAAIEEKKCRPRCPGCFPRKSQNHVHSDDGQTTDTPPHQHESNPTYLSLENYGLQKDNMVSALAQTELK